MPMTQLEWEEFCKSQLFGTMETCEIFTDNGKPGNTKTTINTPSRMKAIKSLVQEAGGDINILPSQAAADFIIYSLKPETHSRRLDVGEMFSSFWKSRAADDDGKMVTENVFTSKLSGVTIAVAKKRVGYKELGLAFWGGLLAEENHKTLLKAKVSCLFNDYELKPEHFCPPLVTDKNDPKKVAFNYRDFEQALLGGVDCANLVSEKTVDSYYVTHVALPDAKTSEILPEKSRVFYQSLHNAFPVPVEVSHSGRYYEETKVVSPIHSLARAPSELRMAVNQTYAISMDQKFFQVETLEHPAKKTYENVFHDFVLKKIIDLKPAKFTYPHQFYRGLLPFIHSLLKGAKLDCSLEEQLFREMALMTTSIIDEIETAFDNLDKLTLTLPSQLKFFNTAEQMLAEWKKRTEISFKRYLKTYVLEDKASLAKAIGLSSADSLSEMEGRLEDIWRKRTPKLLEKFREACRLKEMKTLFSSDTAKPARSNEALRALVKPANFFMSERRDGMLNDDKIRKWVKDNKVTLTEIENLQRGGDTVGEIGVQQIRHFCTFKLTFDENQIFGGQSFEERMYNISFDRKPQIPNSAAQVAAQTEPGNLTGKLQQSEYYHSLIKHTAIKQAIDDFFMCPITLDIMSAAVLASDSHIYDKPTIERALGLNAYSPITREQMNIEDLISLPSFSDLLQYYIKDEQQISVALIDKLLNFCKDERTGHAWVNPRLCYTGSGQRFIQENSEVAVSSEKKAGHEWGELKVLIDIFCESGLISKPCATAVAMSSEEVASEQHAHSPCSMQPK